MSSKVIRSRATAPAFKPLFFRAFTFQVSGSGRFPMELLSFDFCMPSDAHQYVSAFGLHSGFRTVGLTGFRPADSEVINPAIEAWLEKGWQIAKDSIQVVPE